MELKLVLNSGCSQAGLKLKILLPPHPEYSFRFWVCTTMPCLTTQLVIKQSESTQPRPPGDVGYSRESMEVLLCMSVLRPALVGFCQGRWQKLEFAKFPTVAMRLTRGTKQVPAVTSSCFTMPSAASLYRLNKSGWPFSVPCQCTQLPRVILASSQTALWSEPEGSGS